MTEVSDRDLLINLIEQHRVLEQLLEHQGFLVLNEIMQAQADSLQHSLFIPIATIDSALGSEYKKGQLEGRLSWKYTLDEKIDSLEYEIEKLKQRLEDDEDAAGDADSRTAP